MYRHYILPDLDGRILSGWSDGPSPQTDTALAVCLREDGTYQFRLWEVGDDNPTLVTFEGIPLYKWDGGAVLERTAEELAADRVALPPPLPSPEEDLDAMLVDHELRLTLLELGV